MVNNGQIVWSFKNGTTKGAQRNRDQSVGVLAQRSLATTLSVKATINGAGHFWVHDDRVGGRNRNHRKSQNKKYAQCNSTHKAVLGNSPSF